MGSDELERFFPDRKMRIFIGTWNMCEMKLVPESLDDFVLPDTSDFIHDMYVIGTQESVSNRSVIYKYNLHLFIMCVFNST